MSNDAVDLIIADHDVIRGLLDRLARAPHDDGQLRRDLLATIARELRLHAAVEQEIFYPAFKAAGGNDAGQMFYEAIEEHQVIETLLPDLQDIDPTSERFTGRAKVLKHLVEHHAREEESGMLAAARRVFSEQQLADLGARLEGRRRELVG